MPRDPSQRRPSFLPAGEFGQARWTPSADVYRTPNGWLVKFDLAGVAPQDIRLSRRANRLILEGERRDRHCLECAQVYSLEIAYSAFRREVELPVDVEGSTLEWVLQDGLLLVRIQPEGDR